MWRAAARLGAVVAALVGLTVGLAGPALADPYSVRLGLPSGFRVEGSPGSVTVRIARDDKGCVAARWVVTVGLPGMSPDQIRVERSRDGAWHEVVIEPIGDGAVAFASGGALCKDRDITARYRVSFLSGAPGGRAEFVLRATANGGRIGSDSGSRRVSGPRNATPSPSVSASPTESSTPLATTDEPTGALGAVPTRAVAGGGDPDGGFLSGVSLAIMIFGVLMIGTGGALLYFVVRKTRGDSAADLPAPPADTTPTLVLPRIPPYDPGPPHGPPH
ncbi:MAG TPA: hypothetical protein VGJ53_07160 [Micromonosporaceae bacterium]|jgi:hypothetical protein